MPELPEVETTKRGIENQICHKRIVEIQIRHTQLRWPVPVELKTRLPGLVVESVKRRGKYLLLKTAAGHILIHLGMSGHLRVLSQSTPPGKHDHIDLVFEDGTCLRYQDTRRFGAWLWTDQAPEDHPLLSKLGPEPLSDAFNPDYLWQATRDRNTAIKSFMMNSHQLVGVGNIYANESLFLSGLHPLKPAKDLSKLECANLVTQIRQVLSVAIEQGGTTLKDFLSPSGRPGYFVQKLLVYGRADQPCLNCGTAIERAVHFQRASYVCPICQPQPKKSRAKQEKTSK
ncbi:MAG: bifunctional DNA-formamidopyrimidine glycosylase/DNA-(apurinic or apyrimidinic site) lyase [Thiomicrospira sp.]|uniref:bifunctional DNA-formamidopyrimidine glycosylase/DNA-(apurinic or apyrimidinic site) lyase n=1 Tax=Thiomicrospira sp. TaxID=935 RepID=UPI0019EFA97C|nr:bifunctional DNA-formamidopyrimidine glycosylase/DNA-(apurinic or apyrimidinic site) lyase [Thiomicrospira sp.]MBE0493184.1 bifunctional DNA-formamidopyrimidine glycosylase/DNA-(apurinic or apyrimidinic site) lyase [Thiomicrospira sp.]